MDNFLFSPGPAHIPVEVREKMSEEPLHHRSKAFSELVTYCASGLKRVFRTEGEVALLTCSGSGGMEAAAVNFVAEGSTVICVEGGKFGRRWSAICRRLGCEVVPVAVKMKESLEPDRLASLVKSRPNITAVFLTQAESSSGALFNIRKLAEVVRGNSEAVVVVDTIGSLAAEPFFQDEWGLDAAVCGSQKALMCPPGLAFVSVSPAGFEKIIRPHSLYWDLLDRIENQRNGYTSFTPAVNLFCGLKAALEMIFKQGLENVWAETKRLAEAFRAAVKVSGLNVFPVNPASGFTVVELPEGIKDSDVIEKLEASTNFRIAGGQEELKGRVIRIAHMGAVGYEDLKRLIPPLFGCLKELGWKCEPEAALKAFIKGYAR
ncbi:MAG: alanine--glyoxylate aminotransferase family protein [candidate division Zixibacteria bacterium]|nr:alanine--glyoxylate aminotransferase family protein [Candidatus Tariuqbacter arcticus]